MADTMLERQDKAVKDIGVRFARIVERAVAVMEVVSSTHELPRKLVDVVNGDGEVIGSRVELVKPLDMPSSVFHIHEDSMKPERDVPFYLKDARGRVDLAHRIAGDRSNAPQEIARYVVRALALPPREYPVIDIEPIERK